MISTAETHPFSHTSTMSYSNSYHAANSQRTFRTTVVFLIKLWQILLTSSDSQPHGYEDTNNRDHDHDTTMKQMPLRVASENPHLKIRRSLSLHWQLEENIWIRCAKVCFDCYMHNVCAYIYTGTGTWYETLKFIGQFHFSPHLRPLGYCIHIRDAPPPCDRSDFPNVRHFHFRFSLMLQAWYVVHLLFILNDISFQIIS